MTQVLPRVLIVEDHPELQGYLESVVRNAGAVSVTVSDLPSAIERLEAQRANPRAFQLLLLDVMFAAGRREWDIWPTDFLLEASRAGLDLARFVRDPTYQPYSGVLQDESLAALRRRGLGLDATSLPIVVFTIREDLRSAKILRDLEIEYFEKAPDDAAAKAFEDRISQLLQEARARLNPVLRPPR